MISVNIVFLSMKIDFVSAYRADTDEMVHYWHFIWVFTAFLKYLFRGFWSSKG